MIGTDRVRCEMTLPAVDSVEARAYGKVILLGEHAVVHGSSAIATNLEQGATAFASARSASASMPGLRVQDASGWWHIEPDSDLARAYQILCEYVGVEACVTVRVSVAAGVGLGSSACVGAAIARALFAFARVRPSDSDVIGAATQWEKVFHGNPSGIDVTVATLGKCIEFARCRGYRLVPILKPIELCVVDSRQRSSTREMVQQVTTKLAQRSDGGAGWVSQVSQCVSSGSDALARGDVQQLARAMTNNRVLLQQVGVETSAMAQLCDASLDAGALAAKITGAGGGGCVIALTHGCTEQVLCAWQQRGYAGFPVRISAQAGGS